MKNVNSWYAIYTNPRAESKVAERIAELGIEVYCPTVTDIRQWSDRKKKVVRPLFTSYVFVRINIKQFETVRNVYGAVNFVRHLSKPAKIRDIEIKAVKDFLSKVNTSTIVFEPFDEVKINAGVFKGNKGIVQQVGKNTLRIILSELKISVIAQISKSEVEKK